MIKYYYNWFIHTEENNQQIESRNRPLFIFGNYINNIRIDREYNIWIFGLLQDNVKVFTHIYLRILKLTQNKNAWFVLTEVW